ncbi:MAG: class I SAM-dependent methyltransferase [Sideroxyarcus sp.]|nr:class I SAM-dependent methyltransferase [Sideroxyarcus sp.]
MLSKCNLCGWPIVKLNNSVFGTRCVGCRSTQVHRAVGIVFNQLIERSDGLFVYELSSRGALFSFLKKKFTNFYFSEYYDNYPNGLLLENVPCQDVQHLLLKDEVFDVITSTEVFEHVPDDRLGFSEIYRVLKKGGHFIFTVPLNINQEKTIERASIDSNGKCILHLVPEYHNDRIKGKGTVLAFRNYGVDIVRKLNDVGFSSRIIAVDNSKPSIRNQLVIAAIK